ncbi:MAG TPA: hypothetical protein VEL12_15545 [Candidatus Nitrosopolaris sp.]|nr:hypothetical protein [Candidatus Nitrosopolaris sp.]
MANDQTEHAEIRITVAPADNFYERGTSAWNGELAELHTEINRDLANSIERAPGGQEKGDPFTVITLLLSSGAIPGLFQCVKAWIERHPGRRVLDLDWDDGRAKHHLRVDASNVDDASLTAAIAGALTRRH